MNPNNIESLPPIWPSQTFNSSLFQGSGYITKQQADLLYATTLSIRNIKYVNDVTEGTALAQKALITDSSINIANINNITSTGLIRTTRAGQGLSHFDGTINLSSFVNNSTNPGIAFFGAVTNHTLALMTNNVGRITISNAGTVSIGQSCFLGTTSKNICIGTSNDTTRLISALDSALANGSSNSICFGKANSSGQQAELTYTVEATSTNNKISLGFHSNSLITMFNRTGGTGSIMYLCNAPQTATGANVNILNTLALMDVSSDYARFYYNNNKLNFDFYNSSQVLQSSYVFEGDCLKIGPSLLNNQFRLDLGSKGAITGNNDFLINLYNIGLANPTTGIGYTVDDNLFISSAGINGIIFRTTYGLTSPSANITRGTKTHQMWRSGHFESTSGIRAGEFTSVPYAGKGVELHWSTASNLGDVFAYDRTAGTFLPLRFNNIIYTTPSNSRVGINVSSPTVTLDVAGNVLITSSSGVPLVVSGTGNLTKSNTYGWLGPAGAGQATGFSNRPFSIQASGGILVESGEIDSFSDIRMKKNIIEIDDTKALRLLDINPISFLYNTQDDNKIPNIGYRAQDFVKNLFNDVVGFTEVNEDIKLEKETITTIDNTEIILNEDIKLTINQFALIPYLHKLVKIQHNIIKENDIIIKNLQTELDGAYAMISDIQKTITEIHPDITWDEESS